MASAENVELPLQNGNTKVFQSLDRTEHLKEETSEISINEELTVIEERFSANGDTNHFINLVSEENSDKNNYSYHENTEMCKSVNEINGVGVDNRLVENEENPGLLHKSPDSIFDAVELPCTNIEVSSLNDNTESEDVSQHSISDTSISDMSITESVIKENEQSYEENNCSVSLNDAQQQLLVEKGNTQRLHAEVGRLEAEKARLEVEGSHETCRGQIEQQKRELDLCKQEHELDVRTLAAMKAELDLIKKQYETANKEKEATVVRYATSEMELINQRKEKESLEKRLKDIVKERDLTMAKLKTLSGEKARICQMFDNKCSEVSVLQKEVEKLKEDIFSRDIKIKWLQNKIRSDTEIIKEHESKLEKLSLQVQEAKEEAEKAKIDAQASMKQFYESQENRAHTLDLQLKEQQAQLILERHNFEDREAVVRQLQREVETLKAKQQLFIDENNALSLKVQSLEKEKLDYENNVSKLKYSSDKQNHEITELQGKISLMEALKLQLQHEQERLAVCQNELETLRTSNAELVQDMTSCREREADMLEFTQKVTAKNVRLQSEFSFIEAKAQQLECEGGPLQNKVKELEDIVETLKKEIEKERAERCEEKKVVAHHLAEKTARIETLQIQIDDLRGENQVMKHKNAATVRELNRELQHYRKRMEQYENGSGNDSLCQGSRASSCTSLNDTVAVNNNIHSQQAEPDRQALIERIVKLQRSNARYSEKIDFLEENTRQLVSELQKKTKVLQSYILREEAGALSSGSMDHNKAELAKHGGIMASVYGSKQVDDSMTLELSLEINHKLQAVLEDTLLKNITLKENIDTLGDEIARLTQQRLQKT